MVLGICCLIVCLRYGCTVLLLVLDSWMVGGIVYELWVLLLLIVCSGLPFFVGGYVTCLFCCCI